MSNLGKYQEVVTDAKRFGGMEDYLRLIEARAVTRATPRLVTQSVIGTLLVVAGVAGLAREVRSRAAGRRELLLAAEAVRGQIMCTAPPGGATGLRSSTMLNRFRTDVCPVCGTETLRPFRPDALKCSKCGTLVSAAPRPGSPAGDSLCAWCGRRGHGRRTCDVARDAEMCGVCGFHGHSGPDCQGNSERKGAGDE